jgi:hypothetical protein
MKNPMGNQQDEIERLRKKSNIMASKINTGALSATQTKMAYESFYVPALRYSLAITSINQMDFESIQSNASLAILAALGFNRHMPREVVYCTSKYQGLGLQHLYDMQGIDSTRLILQELNHTGATKIMLQCLLELRKVPVNFIHVKSHQDTDKKGRISYDAQMNCMADELARQQNSTMSVPYTQCYPKFTFLKISDTVITSRDSKKWLRDHAGRIPIQQYYANRHGWSKQSFEMIHWSAQHAVLQRYDNNDQRRILKFVHGWLPTYDRLYREKLATTQRCPLCFYLVENNAHLFNCKHPSQWNIQASMMERIQKDNQNSTHKELMHAIIEGITMSSNDQVWKADSQYKNIHINRWINNQNRIGWHQIINGRVAKSLTAAASDLLRQQGTETWNISGEKWTRRFIQILWDTILQLWNNRNNILYDGSQGTAQERKRERLLQRVERCFADSKKLPIDDRTKLFDSKDKDDLMKEDPRNITAWLKMTERIIKVNKKEQARHQRERTLIENYFKWHPPTQQRRKHQRKNLKKNDLKPD